MRLAELVTSALLALLSAYLMVKSMELPIGWLEGEGPGGGAFPFWLALGMLVCSVLIFFRTLTRRTPQGRSTEEFVSGETLRHLAVVVAALAVMIGAIHIIGVYFSVPLFLFFYLRVLGKHSWRLTTAVSLATPVVTFVLFEKILLILLPKGYTDSWFYIFY